MPLVRIRAAEWYEREDWNKWLNSGYPAVRQKIPEKDVFFTISRIDGEMDGSDAACWAAILPAIPEDIWAQITAAIVGQVGDKDFECLVWVTNE